MHSKVCCCQNGRRLFASICKTHFTRHFDMFAFVVEFDGTTIEEAIWIAEREIVFLEEHFIYAVKLSSAYAK